MKYDPVSAKHELEREGRKVQAEKENTAGGLLTSPQEKGRVEEEKRIMERNLVSREKC